MPPSEANKEATFLPKGVHRIAQMLWPWVRPHLGRALQGRPKSAVSIPKVSFIKANPMAFQKVTNFFLEREFSMRFSLLGNGGENRLNI